MKGRRVGWVGFGFCVEPSELEFVGVMMHLGLALLVIGFKHSHTQRPIKYPPSGWLRRLTVVLLVMFTDPGV